MTRPGEYDVELQFSARKTAGPTLLRVAGHRVRLWTPVGTTSARFPGLTLTPGPARLDAELEAADQGPLRAVIRRR